jgi:hypothetical protein
MVLPNCAHYLVLNCIEVVDGGSHDAFVCKVTKMWTTYSEICNDYDESYLSTRQLRKLGIITKQGRVTED